MSASFRVRFVFVCLFVCFKSVLTPNHMTCVPLYFIFKHKITHQSLWVQDTTSEIRKLKEFTSRTIIKSTKIIPKDQTSTWNANNKVQFMRSKKEVNFSYKHWSGNISTSILQVPGTTKSPWKWTFCTVWNLIPHSSLESKNTSPLTADPCKNWAVNPTLL